MEEVIEPKFSPRKFVFIRRPQSSRSVSTPNKSSVGSSSPPRPASACTPTTLTKASVATLDIQLAQLFDMISQSPSISGAAKTYSRQLLIEASRALRSKVPPRTQQVVAVNSQASVRPKSLPTGRKQQPATPLTQATSATWGNLCKKAKGHLSCDELKMLSLETLSSVAEHYGFGKSPVHMAHIELYWRHFAQKRHHTRNAKAYKKPSVVEAMVNKAAVESVGAGSRPGQLSTATPSARR
jgi:hypothetical protein